MCNNCIFSSVDTTVLQRKHYVSYIPHDVAPSLATAALSQVGAAVFAFSYPSSDLRLVTLPPPGVDTDVLQVAKLWQPPTLVQSLVIASHYLLKTSVQNEKIPHFLNSKFPLLVLFQQLWPGFDPYTKFPNCGESPTRSNHYDILNPFCPFRQISTSGRWCSDFGRVLVGGPWW